MSTNEETSSGGFLDTAKLALAVMLVVGGIVGFYYYKEQSLLIAVSVLLVAVGMTAFVFMLTERGRLLWQFVQGSRVEIRKVVWPTRTETVQTTLTVFLFAFVMALFFWGLDYLLLSITRYLTGQGG